MKNTKYWNTIFLPTHCERCYDSPALRKVGKIWLCGDCYNEDKRMGKTCS
jgi:hypothetical protein